MATELNLVESYSAPDFVSDALTGALRTLVGYDGALPWTGEVLKLEAEAHLRGEHGSQLPLDSIMLIDPAESRRDLRDRLNAFRRRTDESHRRLHADARPRIQRKLKEKKIRPVWDDFPAFLEVWQGMETREILARQSWRDLGLPDPFAPDVLIASESWRLMSDADGIGIFQAAIAFEQPPQVQRMDQLQLPYLGGADRRVLVTRDGAFAEAAKYVVNGRYGLARVLTLAEFLDNSGIE